VKLFSLGDFGKISVSKIRTFGIELRRSIWHALSAFKAQESSADVLKPATMSERLASWRIPVSVGPVAGWQSPPGAVVRK